MATGNEILSKLWVEKYRPKKLEDVVLEEAQMGFLQDCLNDGEVPNLLFIGPPGSGKTTTARILCDVIIKDDSDILLLNGSETTGVDTVRHEIMGFLKSPPYISRHKIIFIDEFDYMSLNAQASLRHIMEDENMMECGRFICTGNYISKILDPLQSRFQIFKMDTISEDFAVQYVTKILDSEGIKYLQDNVRLVVQSLLPDVRKVVNTLQKNVVDNELKGIDKESIITSENKLVGLICLICDSIGTEKQDLVINSNVAEITKVLVQGDVDFIRMYEVLFKNEKIPPWGKITINKYSNNHLSTAIPFMHFLAMIWEIILNGKQYYKMFGTK